MTTLYGVSGSAVAIYTTEGSLVWGDPGPPDPPDPVIYRSQVMDRCRPSGGVHWGKGRGFTTALSRSLRKVYADAPDLQLMFNNLDGLVAGRAAYNLAVAIESEDASSVQRLTFQGEGVTTVMPGAQVVTDPVNVTAGNYWLRVWMQVETEFQFSEGDFTDGPGEGTALNLNVDAIDTAGPVVRSHTGMLCPAAAVASVNSPAVGIVGDSVSMGLGSGSRGSFDLGPAAAGVPAVMWGKGGSRSRQHTTEALDMLTLEDPGVDAILVEHGLNSSSEGITLQQQREVDLWMRLAARWPSIPLYQATINPYTTSTNGWATAGGQTEVYPGVQGAYNSWIRNGAPIINGSPTLPGTTGALRAGDWGHPLAGWIEVGGPVETSIGSNLWAANLTLDGLHPYVGGEALMTPPVRQWASAFA